MVYETTDAQDVAGRDRARPRAVSDKPRRRSRDLLIARVAIPAVCVALWAIIAPTTTLVPSVQGTLVELWSGFTEGWVYAGLGSTVSAVAQGFGAAMVAGLTFGYFLGRSPAMNRIFEPFIAGLFAVPRIVIYPVLLTLFGIGLTAERVMVAISAFFPIVMAINGSVRQVRPSLVKLGRSFNLNRAQLAMKIVLPAALPGIMVGMRIGFSISFTVAIIAELFAARSGLGVLIIDFYGALALEQMFAVVLLVGIISFGGNMLLWWVERRLPGG